MKLFVLLSVIFINIQTLTAQTLQTVVNNGNIVTSPVILQGRLDLGESYDPTPYGAVQITRPVSQDFKQHLSFIRQGQMVYGLGFYHGTNVFAIQAGGDNRSTQGIFLNVVGNVGIGTTLPKAKLDVGGGIMVQSTLTNTSARPLTSAANIPGEIRGYSASDYQADDGFLRLSSGAGSNPGVLSYIDLSGYSTLPDMNMNIVMGTNGTERLRVLSSGNVGIGTATPSEKLSVNGKIRAREIKVEIANWPDYVFLPSYKIPTLQETEKYIKENGHLPGIPSAAEVEKNGVELGDMNKKLLQKIEELTLHLIEKDKIINSLLERVDKLETRNK